MVYRNRKKTELSDVSPYFNMSPYSRQFSRTTGRFVEFFDLILIQGQDIGGAGEFFTNPPVGRNEPASPKAGETDINGVIDGKIVAPGETDGFGHDFLVHRLEDFQEEERPNDIEGGVFSNLGLISEDVRHLVPQKVRTANLVPPLTVVLPQTKGGRMIGLVSFDKPFDDDGSVERKAGAGGGSHFRESRFSRK